MSNPVTLPLALRIEHLSKTYGNGVRALDDVSLTIPQGMYGLLGPNGAGKSTLMRCIATLQIPTSGSIRFDDIDVLAAPDALRRTLGYLPQDFGVYPRVSACEMLDHPRVILGRQRILDIVRHQFHQFFARQFRQGDPFFRHYCKYSSSARRTLLLARCSSTR